MNGFNQRYDFDRDSRRGSKWSRVLPVLIFLAVLAVTVGIIYLIMGHGPGNDAKKPSKGDGQVSAAKEKKDQAVPDTRKVGGTDLEQGQKSAENAVLKPEGEKNSAVSPETAVAPETDNPDAVVGTPVADPLERAVEVIVQPGETLGGIARRYHTTKDGIKYFNKLKSDTIMNGQKLKVIPGPWRITVKRDELVLEHTPKGEWRLFGRFAADAAEMKNTGISELSVSFMRKRPDWVDAHGRRFAHGDPENPYGEYLLMLARRGRSSDPLAGFGIHGVDDKTSNLKNCGRGHIHVGARDIELLYHLVCPGTDVFISGETARKPEM